jgi:carboxyl-terminal processing protease
MRRHSTLFAPGLVLLVAILAGGWFLQKGIGQERNVYFQVRLFEEVMDHVVRSYVEPVSRQDLYESAIDGVLRELGDPNSSFLPASSAQDLRIRMEGEYGGVGLEVIPRDGWVTVQTPLPGGPGARIGIRAGDQIVEVEGESVEGWDPDEVVAALRGTAGTEVSLKVRRPGVDVPIPFTFTRETIRLRSVPFALVLPGSVGYLPIQTLAETSSREVRTAVDSLVGEGIRGLILDLRGNPGGPLDQGIAITDYFLDSGQMVVQTKGRASNQNETFNARERLPYPDLSVVVLVDERSASASEIIAGALQDHDRAVVLGAPTFGKGSVQTLFPLTGGNYLRLTTARWYTPLGRSIHKDREDQIAAMERSVLTPTRFLVTLPDTTAKPVFETPAGRRVFGGGGIVPDVLVMADTLTSREREALRELDRTGGMFINTVFNFAVEYVQKNPEPEPDFRLESSDLRRFQEMLRASGAELSEDGFRESERFIRFQLEKEIALRARGPEGEFLRILSQDRILQQALSLLKDSSSPAELLALAADPGRSDWLPVVKEVVEEAAGRVEPREEESGAGDERVEGKDDGGERAPGARRAPGAGKVAGEERVSGPELVVGAWGLPSRS